MASAFKHDSSGFLVGELLDVNRELLDAQNAGTAVWRGIGTDVKAIARALGVQVRKGSSPSGKPAGQAGSVPQRASNGQFMRKVAQPSGRAGRATTRTAPASEIARAAAASTVNREKRRATVGPAGRNGRVRYAGVSDANAAEIGNRNLLGQFTGGGKNSSGAGTSDRAGVLGIGEKLTGAIDKLSGSLDGADQLDPTITAMKEIKDAVSPLGRGLFSMFGRGAERKKERWYIRFLKALTGRRIEPGAGGGGAGVVEASFGGTFLGELLGKATAFIGPLLAGIGSVLLGGLGLLGAAALGTYVGGKIYEWLDKSGIATKIFDAFDSIGEWFRDKVKKPLEKVKDDFNKGDAAVDRTRLSPEQLRRSELNTKINPDGTVTPGDPNPPLAPAASIAESLGRGRAQARNFLTEKMGFGQTDAGNDPVARSKMTPKQRAAADLKQRSLETGAQYSAGNIGNLSDAQTRALVASTAMTESGGGNPRVVNSAGYMGRYQAGAGWLADAGLISGGSGAIKKAMAQDGFTFGKPGEEDRWGRKGGMTKFLQDEKNWTGGLSYEKYLGSADTQDKAFKTVSDSAYKSLMANPNVTDKSPESIAGLLKARHIAGMGGALTVAKGGSGASDSNGTSARKYFDDVAKDKNGFLSAYTGGATVAAGYVRIPPVAIPSSVPERIQPAPDAAIPAQLNTTKPAPVNVSMREPIGQDVGDRSIAHVVSGGLGMMA